jgi:hypothetical protein
LLSVVNYNAVLGKTLRFANREQAAAAIEASSAASFVDRPTMEIAASRNSEQVAGTNFTEPF